MKQKLHDSFVLFYVCLIMGTTVFGGGYAMLPIIEREFCDKRSFVGKDEIADILALAQSVPGLISVNSVIIIGYRTAGFLGAMFAMLGMAIPSFVIIVLLSYVYTAVVTNKYVGFALIGIRAGVIGLMASAVVKMFRSAIKDIPTIIISILALWLILMLEFGVWTWLNPIYIILAGLVAGFITTSISERRILKKQSKEKNTENIDIDSVENSKDNIEKEKEKEKEKEDEVKK